MQEAACTQMVCVVPSPPAAAPPALPVLLARYELAFKWVKWQKTVASYLFLPIDQPCWEQGQREHSQTLRRQSRLTLCLLPSERQWKGQTGREKWMEVTGSSLGGAQ